MKITVRHLDPSLVSGEHYDLFVGAAGYESRATFAFEALKPATESIVAVRFSEQRVLAYESNARYYDRLAARFIPDDDAAVAQLVRDSITAKQGACSASPLKVLVDISSITRKILARLAYEFGRESGKGDVGVLVDFVYSLSGFGSKPSAFGPLVDNGPAIPPLGGWSKAPTNSPCGVILGIGYEEDLAVGAVETLEAGRVWALRPINEDDRYETAIEEGNRGLFEIVPRRQIIRYSLRDAYSTFASLEALAGLVKRDYRLLIIPFGPKIFSLAACLTCLTHFPEVGLWRVSGGANRTPVDREPNGRILGLRVSFAAPRATATDLVGDSSSKRSGECG